MLRTKCRRVLASLVLASTVLLLPVHLAGAEPRRAGGREGVRSSIGIFGHWQHLVWSFLVDVLEKGSSSLNPDGQD